MATSSFQKNFKVTKKQQDDVSRVMTSDSIGALISKNFKTKFETVEDNRKLFSGIFSEKT